MTSLTSSTSSNGSRQPQQTETARDRLADISYKACPSCDSAFDSISLSLHEVAFADSEGLEALTVYSREVSIRGGQVSIHTSRRALRHLMLAGPLSNFVAAEGDDETGSGEPFTCPHR